MIALKICDLKLFMSGFLVQNVFDNFWLSEFNLTTYQTVNISGKLNKSWYSNEEQEALGERDYLKWEDVRPIAFQLMKGNKTPHSFKIVLRLSREHMKELIERSNSKFKLEEVDGFFINMQYENNNLNIITGVSMKTFSLEKSLEHEWDEEVQRFLKSKGIAAEIK